MRLISDFSGSGKRKKLSAFSRQLSAFLRGVPITLAVRFGRSRTAGPTTDDRQSGAKDQRQTPLFRHSPQQLAANRY